jgi:hypothetical protein
MPLDIIDCDVVIQAGHEDTPDDKTGGEGPLGKEIEWTPVVANEAVQILQQAGIKAVKETAHIKVTGQRYRCKLALFIHFDDPDHGEAGPSVGYDHSSDADAAQEWKTLYKEFFPFNETWLPDNATTDEQHYYAFKYTVTSDAEFVVELGDLGSLRQAKWLQPRLKWLGQLLAYFVSHRIGIGGLQKPAPLVLPCWSRTYGCGGPNTWHESGRSPRAFQHGRFRFCERERVFKDQRLEGNAPKVRRRQRYGRSDGGLTASRIDGLDGTLTAFCRRVQKGNTIAVEQDNYSYKDRHLPDSALFLDLPDIPADVPDGFQPTPVKAVKASQFGKNDHQDEGTGSPIMGLIQTNSEVFGGSVKVSVMKDVFGADWRNNDKRLRAMIDIYFAQKKRMVRVPLVDIGPAENAPSHAEVDLTWACDRFLGTDGLANVRYRMLVPV